MNNIFFSEARVKSQRGWPRVNSKSKLGFFGLDPDRFVDELPSDILS